MFRDVDPYSFSAIYLVCGRTDMRYGIDPMAAIIENRYHLPPVRSGRALSLLRQATNRLKGLLWESDGFLLFTNPLQTSSCIAPSRSPRPV